MSHPQTASVLLLAVAALAACAKQTSTTAPVADTHGGVRCLGINSCKGMGECSYADHSCGKHTPCKGQGWLTVQDADACAARGGTVL